VACAGGVLTATSGAACPSPCVSIVALGGSSLSLPVAAPFPLGAVPVDPPLKMHGGSRLRWQEVTGNGHERVPAGQPHVQLPVTRSPLTRNAKVPERKPSLTVTVPPSASMPRTPGTWTSPCT
jgi:hypothetical protein